MFLSRESMTKMISSSVVDGRQILCTPCYSVNLWYLAWFENSIGDLNKAKFSERAVILTLSQMTHAAKGGADIESDDEGPCLPAVGLADMGC
jgi:hypothetical protein